MIPRHKEQPGIWDGISLAALFDVGGKHGLRDIFDLIAQMYLRLTWHSAAVSYYGKAAADRQDDLDPSEFMLDVVNDAKTLRNKVEDFLSVPRNTFESERPTSTKLQNVKENAEEDFHTLLSTPLDIKQLIIESRRRS